MADLDMKDVTIVRVFDAPRELVFKAFTDNDLVAQWWGPKDFDVPYCNVDPRSGGIFEVHMRAPDGEIFAEQGAIRELLPPERMVLVTTAFKDETGQPQLEVINTLTFTEQDGKTTLTLHAKVIRATPAVAEPLSWMESGWQESFDKLEVALERAKAGQ